MSTTLPSREAIIIDVPEVRNFGARFQYNFFASDEGVNETGGMPAKLLERRSETFDATYVDTLTTRAPRYVRIDFTPAVISPKNKNVDDNEIRNNNIRRFDLDKDYIRQNFDKILSEDFFAADNFTAISLSDQSIDKKLFQIISGTAAWLTSDKERFEAKTHKKLSRETNALTPDDVEYQFLTKFLVQPSENNTFFFERDSQRIRNDAVNRLKDVRIHFQMNNKFIFNLLKMAVVNPDSTFSSDFVGLFNVSSAIQQRAQRRSSSDMARDDYKVIADYTTLSRADSVTSTAASSARVVGYVVDKYEILPNGDIKTCQPIIIESPFVGSTLDIRVRYYSTYVYSIRTIVEFTVPAVSDETNELVIAKLLICSKPSPKIKVDCRELVPPPSPTDFSFHWDYEKSKLVLTWSFPPNPQRDVKKFQVFRRESLEHPYQLLQMFDFDDSEVKAEPGETVFASLVTKDPAPVLQYVDPDFKKESKFIYAVACIDAHGMTSNYSDQFEITFDRFKNRLLKKRVSASGAPKNYPNMYLLADTFVDMMLTEDHKSVDIVFHPDHLSLFDSERRDLEFLATSNNGAKYRMQFINLDLQKQRVLEITVDDLRKFKDLGTKVRGR
jgi:hypothetical protein